MNKFKNAVSRKFNTYLFWLGFSRQVLRHILEDVTAPETLCLPGISVLKGLVILLKFA